MTISLGPVLAQQERGSAWIEPAMPSPRFDECVMLRTVSLDVAVPVDASVSLEKSSGGRPDLLHISREGLRASLSVLASPRSGDHWNQELLPRIAERLADDGLNPRGHEWGTGSGCLVRHRRGFLGFIGESGSGWTLRMVLSASGAHRLFGDYDWAITLFADAAVRRGREAHPVNWPLDLSLLPSGR